MSSLQKDFWDFTKATSGNKSCAEVSKFDSDPVDWRGNQMFLKCLRRPSGQRLRLSPEYNSGPHLNYLNNKLQRNRKLNMNSISWLVRLDRSLQVSSFHEPRSVFNAFLKKGSKRMGHPLAFPFSSSVLISAPCSRKDYPQTPSLQAALVQPDYTTSVSSVLQSFPSLLHDVTMTLMSSPLGTVWWQWGGATKWHDCGDESSISQWGQLEIYRGGAYRDTGGWLEQIYDVMKVEVPPAADGRSVPTVTGREVSWSLVSRVLVGGEGSEGGWGRERQGVGLRNGPSHRRRVCRWLWDAEKRGGRSGFTF